MTKIKRVKFSNIQNFEHFMLNVFEEIPTSGNFLVEFLHSLLPNWQKRLNEHYAAIEDKKILCEVSISPQSRKNARWHINHLAIGECSDEIISRLIKYVMNKYGGDGVETFITFVNDAMPELKELFKKGCNFRECAHLELWKTAPDNNLPNNDSVFVDYNKKYLKQMVDLYNNMIFPQFRQALKLNKEDIKRRTNKALIKKVLYNQETNSVEGYFLVFKKNGVLYLEALLSDAFATYYPEILNYCKRNLQEEFGILLKKYHTSYKVLQEALTAQNAEKQSSYAILVKDYWSPIKEKENSLLNLSMNISSPA